MPVSKADYCCILIWTTADFVVVRVEPDLQFMEEYQQKAKDFFTNVNQKSPASLQGVNKMGMKSDNMNLTNSAQN